MSRVLPDPLGVIPPAVGDRLVAFSPDGALATGSEDGTARLYDATTGAARAIPIFIVREWTYTHGDFGDDPRIYEKDLSVPGGWSPALREPGHGARAGGGPTADV